MTGWQQARRILAIRLDAAGDVLMTSPALRALKGDGSRHVTLLTSPAGAKAAAMIPEVDAVIEYRAPWMKASGQVDSHEHLALIERLRNEAFDAAVIFTVYSQNPQPAALLATLAEIPLRLAHCRENPYGLLTDWVAEPEPERLLRHETRRQLDLVASVGLRTEDERLSFRPPEVARARVRELVAGSIDEEQPWAVIHAGATASSRRYAPGRFAEIARRLSTQHGWQFIYTGRPEEVDLVEEIRAQAGGTSISLAGELDLGELGALIEAAPLLISNNTGPAHIAAAVGTPVVSMYALTNPQHAPWQVPHRLLYRQVPCAPCYRSVCPAEHHRCLDAVRPDDAVRAALELAGDHVPQQALLLDLDGVLLETEALHRESTMLALDALRATHAVPPRASIAMQYETCVLGRDRYLGMATLLRALGIHLPTGDESDNPGTESAAALANLKNRLYWSLIEQRGVPVMPGALDLLRAARDRGFALAVVSSSRNAPRLLEASGLDRLVDVIVPGDVSQPAKPDPAPYLRAVEMLAIDPAACIAIEDSPAGIESARAAGVGRVIGLATGAMVTGRLLERGAHDVVDGLGRLALLTPDMERGGAPQPLATRASEEEALSA